jgi:hypothetical protein
MTTVEVLYHYASAPTESVTLALATARDVYGIRKFKFDKHAQTLRVEYDATRLNAAAVTRLILQSGLEIKEQSAQIPELAQLQPAPVA